MNKYLFVVYGPSADSEQDRAAGMALMADWYQSLGPALVDPGAPFTGARTVSDEGSERPSAPTRPATTWFRPSPWKRRQSWPRSVLC